MTWPTHPDGSNKTIGEMTAEERREQVAASVRRFAARRARTWEQLAAQLGRPAARLSNQAKHGEPR